MLILGIFDICGLLVARCTVILARKNVRLPHEHNKYVRRCQVSRFLVAVSKFPRGLLALWTSKQRGDLKDQMVQKEG